MKISFTRRDSAPDQADDSAPDQADGKLVRGDITLRNCKRFCDAAGIRSTIQMNGNRTRFLALLLSKINF